MDTKTPAHGDTPRAKLTLLKFKIKIGNPKKNVDSNSILLWTGEEKDGGKLQQRKFFFYFMYPGPSLKIMTFVNERRSRVLRAAPWTFAKDYDFRCRQYYFV